MDFYNVEYTTTLVAQAENPEEAIEKTNRIFSRHYGKLENFYSYVTLSEDDIDPDEFDDEPEEPSPQTDREKLLTMICDAVSVTEAFDIEVADTLEKAFVALQEEWELPNIAPPHRLTHPLVRTLEDFANRLIEDGPVAIRAFLEFDPGKDIPRRELKALIKEKIRWKTVEDLEEWRNKYGIK